MAAENEILKSKLGKRVPLTNSDRRRLARIAKRIGEKGLAGVPCIVKPETLLHLYRKLVAKKFDGSKKRKYAGRPRVSHETEQAVVRFAQEIPNWGQDRIQGALANLGIKISDRTVGNILARNGMAPAPKRDTGPSWKEFIASHKEVTVAADFFTSEIVTSQGLATFYVLILIDHGRGESAWRGRRSSHTRAGCNRSPEI